MSAGRADRALYRQHTYLSFRILFPKYWTEPRVSSTCLNGLFSTVTQARTIMPSATALRWAKKGLPRLDSLMSLAAIIASLIGFSRFWYVEVSEPVRSGFLALVVMRRNLRCSLNPWRTFAACGRAERGLATLGNGYCQRCVRLRAPAGRLNRSAHR